MYMTPAGDGEPDDVLITAFERSPDGGQARDTRVDLALINAGATA
jgi:hypothetical protein